MQCSTGSTQPAGRASLEQVDLDNLHSGWNKRRWFDFFLLPDRNGDRVTGMPSRGNEHPNVFMKRSPWLEPLHKNILQAGQDFCYSAPHELFQGSRDIWRKLLG